MPICTINPSFLMSVSDELRLTSLGLLAGTSDMEEKKNACMALVSTQATPTTTPSQGMFLRDWL